VKHTIRNLVRIFVIILLSGGGCYLYLGARFPFYESVQKRAETLAGRLDFRQTMIQSFITTEPYLSSIILSGEILENAETCPTVSLKLQNTKAADVATKIMKLPCSSGNFEVNFSFHPQADSAGKQYFLSIENLSYLDNFSFWRSENDGYSDGQLHVNDELIPADLFFLTYSRPPIYVWFINSIVNSRFWLLIFITGLYVSWGYCVLGLFSSKPAQSSFKTQIFLSLVISIILPILIIQSVNFLHIRISKYFVYSTILAPILLYFIKQVVIQRTIGCKKIPLSYYFPKNYSFTKWWPDLLLPTLFLVAVLSRTAQVNDIYVPNWLDGQIHQQILGRILDSKISIGDLYHTGFHAFAAYLNLIFGLSSPESIIVAGQWLGLVSGLTLYPLLRKYTSSPLYALFGAAVYWFLLPFPSYLISWARYPLLLGMVILPAAIILNLDWLQGKDRGFILPFASAIALIMAHYGAFLAFLLIISSYILWNAFSRLQKKPGDLVSSRIRAFIIVMSIPIISFVSIKIATLISDNSLQNVIAQNSLAIATTDLVYVIKITLRNGGLLVWILSAYGLIYAIICKRDLLVPTAIWTIVQLLVYLIEISIIGAAISSITNLLVVLSIPLALLAANSAEMVMGFAKLKSIRLPVKAEHKKLLFFVFTSFFIIMSAYNISGVINPVTVLYNRNDQNAIEWIQNNTDQSASFLIDAFQWGGEYVSSDGGGWINYLSGRQTIFPTSPANFTDSSNLIDKQGIKYIYLGQGYGDLNPSQFQNDSYGLVYQNRGIKIYKVFSQNPAP
jgi:hypothetical protein